MEPKQAIALAKAHLTETFGDELSSPPTLEEIWFDESKDQWCVTLGVRRPSNFVERDLLRDPLGSKARVVPDYKVVRVSNTKEKVESVLNRDMVKV